jgi:1-deoxy-D-xylulose-5-phosphate synthase
MSKTAPKTLPDVTSISSPAFLRGLTNNELKKMATRIRHHIIKVVGENGGHLSSNLGVVELTMALHKHFDFLKDKILFDVGHQGYTHKILTGRNLETLRQQNGLSGFLKREESPYDCFEAGHSSTSLSAALGMAVARDLKKEHYEVVAFIGDASINNGLALEGLNNISSSNHKVIIILNDNEMSISPPVGGFSHFLSTLSKTALYKKSKSAYYKVMQATRFGQFIYEKTAALKNKIKTKMQKSGLFKMMGLNYLGPVYGHDFVALDKILQKASKSTTSVLVHVRTIKGKGWEQAEKDKVGKWHGVGPFDPHHLALKTPLDNPLITWSKVYADLLENEMLMHNN